MNFIFAESASNDMNIQVFVSRKGKVAFTCDGEFHKRISQIVLDVNSGRVRIIFQPDLEILELNCRLSQDLCNKVRNQLFCVMGYFKDGKLIATEYLRFTCR